MQSVVILGAGFGGLAVARTLERRLRPYPNWRIELIDANPCHEFHFLFYEAATALAKDGVEGEAEVWGSSCVPLRLLLEGRRINFTYGKVASIARQSRSVKLAGGRTIPYDILVLALGSVIETYQISGVERFALFLKTYEDAKRLRAHIMKLVEEAKSCDPTTRACKLRFVIVGGGFTGVELAAELAHFVKKLARRQLLAPELVEVVVVEAGDRILPGIPSSLAERAQRRLERAGVRFLLNTRIREDKREGAMLLSGEEIKSETVVWTAGVRGNPLPRHAGFTVDEKDRVIVLSTLELPGHHRIFAIGDGAVVPDMRTGKPLPALASVALDEGRHVARNTIHTIRGEPLVPFTPRRNYPIAVPLGGKNALYVRDGLSIFGVSAWWVKQLLSLRYFLELFTPLEAFSLWLRSVRLFAKND